MPTSKDYTIEQIINNIENGDFRIPKFQRDFVWNQEDILNLIDSILCGFPIGSIIIWKTKEQLVDLRELGERTFPDKKKGMYTYYVIDGQQRLTSLFVAARGIKISKADCSNACINLRAKKNGPIVLANVPPKAKRNDYVMIKHLFDVQNHPESITNTHYQKERIEYMKKLVSYNVSVIEIDESASIEEVIEIFERLNVKGKSLNLFSIIAARSYIKGNKNNQGFDLYEKIKKLNNRLIGSYGKISESTILQSIAACLINSCKRKDILQKLNAGEIKQKYKKIEDAFLRAVECLKDDKYGAIIQSLLPYECMLVPFTYFFYKLDKNNMTTKQREYLVDFYWRSVLGGRYASSSDTNLTIDLNKMNDILQGKIPKQEAFTLSSEYIIENGKFVKTSAFIKGILCLYASKHPKSLDAGSIVNINKDALCSSQKKQYHHFFPKKSLAITKKKNKYDVNHILNIVFMDALTNDKINNSNPSVYIDDYRNTNQKLSDSLATLLIKKISNEKFDNMLKRYGIENDNYELFITERSKTVYYELLKNIISKTKTNPNILQEF